MCDATLLYLYLANYIITVHTVFTHCSAEMSSVMKLYLVKFVIKFLSVIHLHKFHSTASDAYEPNNSYAVFLDQNGVEYLNFVVYQVQERNFTMLYYHEPWSFNFDPQKCRYTNCVYTRDISVLKGADAVLVNARNIMIPESLRKDQILVLHIIFGICIYD